MNIVNDEDLLPCPFCGGTAYFERHGSRIQSSIIMCEDCGCRLESNEMGHTEGMNWNNRVQFSKQLPVKDPANTPYFHVHVNKTEKISTYNPNYGDHRICDCGHPYARHFDGYEENAAVGCKYCGCQEFKENKNED